MCEILESLETREFDTLPSQLPPKTLGEKICNWIFSLLIPNFFFFFLFLTCHGSPVLFSSTIVASYPHITYLMTHAKLNAIMHSVTRIKWEKQVYAVSDVRHWILITVIENVITYVVYTKLISAYLKSVVCQRVI